MSHELENGQPSDRAMVEIANLRAEVKRLREALASLTGCTTERVPGMVGRRGKWDIVHGGVSHAEESSTQCAVCAALNSSPEEA